MDASGRDPIGRRDREPLEVIDLGRLSFEEAYAFQEARLAARIRGEVPDALILVEHDPVVTRGRRSADGDATGVPFPVVDIERGGEATYHGPGQLVAYPILELPEGRRDLHRYLRDLEEVVIDTIAAFGVAARREEGMTGVWIGDGKVCSIGVAVRRWVTWHGLALNVTTDLAAFRSFSPCGLRPDVMTRLIAHVGRGADPAGLERGDAAPIGVGAVPMEEVRRQLVAAFRSCFGGAPGPAIAGLAKGFS